VESAQLGITAMAFLSRLKKDTSGITAIEYGMIAGGIALFLVVAINTLGGSTLSMFDNVGAAFS
jgi:pilus assembly protein Flp/PilA